jgi:hypothetical protein
MSGWDTSSRPSWERSEGQEDSTQAFSAPDLVTGADDPWSAAAASASPPPEFFPDYGQQQEPPRPGFRQESDLARRGRHHAAAAAADAAYGREPGYGQEVPYGQEPPYGAEAGVDSAYGQDGAYGRESAYGQDGAYGQDLMPRPEGVATGRDRPGDYPGDRTGSRPAASAPWEDGPRLDAGQGPGPRFDTPEFSRGDGGRPGFDDPQFAPRDGAQPDHGRPDMSRDLVRRDPGAGSFGWGQQAPSNGAPVEREAPEQMDPALQDFFAPQQPRPGVPPSGNGRRVPGATLSGFGQPGSDRPGFGQLGSGQPGSGQPGSGGQRGPGVPGDQGGQARPAANGRRPWTDSWEAPRETPAPPRGGAPAPLRDGPAARPRRDDTLPPRRPTGRPPAPPTNGGGWDRRWIYAIGAVVAVAIIVYVLMTTHHSNSSNTDANTPPPVSPTATVTKSAAKPTVSAKPSGPVYTLSTPATAGGYPTGQDPHFLATATTTAQSVVSAVKSGGGGTVKGAPVSASYRLPVGEQVLEFVGYQGTFDPAKIKTILASLGSDPNIYPAGPHGGILGCANTPGSTSGAVCVWATSSTLGVTEFFSASGPEALTASQSKGAQIVVNLRSGVETVKS